MRTAIAWIITAVWVALYTRKVVDPSFPVPAEVTPVMLVVAGFLFGKDIKDKIVEKVKKTVEEKQDE